MSLFWAAQRPVVDRARRLLARIRRPTPAPAWGPLLLPHTAALLANLADQPLEQPDATSCGSSTLTMLRMLRHPAYAEAVLAAADPQRVFGGAALGVRERTNALLDARGRLQLPWPAALGVRPAAMARLLASDAGYGAPGQRYRVVDVDPAHPDRAFDAAVAHVRAGEPVPLYVGDGHWMQHIVLLVRADHDALTAYDPALGRLTRISRADFSADLAGNDTTSSVAGWPRPWLALLMEYR